MEIIIFVVIALLLGSRRGSDSSLPTGAPETLADRLASLKRRAAQGATWFDDLFAAMVRAGTPADQALIAAAILSRWVGIESSGDSTTKTAMNERGILQADQEGFVKAGYTIDEFNSLSDPSLPRAKQADYAIGYVRSLVNQARARTGWTNPVDLLYAAKVYHSLPLLAKELADQKIYGANHKQADEAWKGGKYQPSAKVIGYGKPTRDPAGVYHRFGTSAWVVANG